MLVLVVGPSGAGKDTLLAGARQALAHDTRFRFVRRAITRPAEAGGEDHEPLDDDAFDHRARAGGFALSWAAHGLRYGVPADIADDLGRGRVVVVNVSRGVIAQAAVRHPTMVVEVTASPAILAARLLARGREDAASIAARVARRMDLPDGVPVVRVLNDAAIADGVAAMVAALRRAAETARPG